MRKINVLSLFDGISCGQLALERAGIEVESYHASEIEKSAIDITQKNFPNTIQLGDVKNWREWNIKKTSLITAGSPCQGLSLSGKRLNFNDPRSKLFFEFVDIVQYYEPEYFLLENVKMNKECEEIITNCLGVEPIMINSNLVSAQNRKRWYWTNIPGVDQPEDRSIVLKDIFIDEPSLYRTDPRILKTAKKTKNYIKFDLSEKGHYSQQHRLYFLDGKSPTVAKSRTESKLNILLDESDYSKYKIISPIEAERLQTLPDNYTEGVTKTKRFEAIGNGWTVDVLAHIFKRLRTVTSNLQQKRPTKGCTQ